MLLKEYSDKAIVSQIRYRRGGPIETRQAKEENQN